LVIHPAHPPTHALGSVERQGLLQLMRAVVTEGTGQAANLSSVPTFGKTGTSQDYRDAYFIGFVGDVVIGVWVGNDDNTPMRKVVGGMLPAQIWRQVMQAAVERRLVHVAPLLDQPLSPPPDQAEPAEPETEATTSEDAAPDAPPPPLLIAPLKPRVITPRNHESRPSGPVLVNPPAPIRDDPADHARAGEN
jgi:penicillin-binding protein 1A